MSEEYDLKKSERGIGQLYPILEAKDGEVIDGVHRDKADKNWKRIRLPQIDTEEKKLLARLIANFHRRQVTWEEKEKWINGLAELYKQEGVIAGEISKRIQEKTGLSQPTVDEYLHQIYKGDSSRRERKEYATTIPASQVIIHRSGKEYGEKLVARHREEVIAEEKPKIIKEVKNELLRNPEFIREAIERAPELVPTLPHRTIERAKELIEPKEMLVKEGTVYTVGEYECPHCKKHYLIKCDGKEDWVE